MGVSGKTTTLNVHLSTKIDNNQPNLTEMNNG